MCHGDAGRRPLGLLSLLISPRAVPSPDKRRTNGHGFRWQAVGDAAQGHKHFAPKRNKQQFMVFGAAGLRHQPPAAAAMAFDRALAAKALKAKIAATRAICQPGPSRQAARSHNTSSSTLVRKKSTWRASIRFALFIQVLYTLPVAP